jgi:hypothetical protein
MSQENVDRFLELADAFNRGDLDAASDWLGPEVVFEPQAAALEGNVVGPDDAKTFMTVSGTSLRFSSSATRTSETSETGCWPWGRRVVWAEEAESSRSSPLRLWRPTRTVY